MVLVRLHLLNTVVVPNWKNAFFSWKLVQRTTGVPAASQTNSRFVMDLIGAPDFSLLSGSRKEMKQSYFVVARTH